MNTELQGNARMVFLAIARGEFDKCPVKGPALAGSIGALKKRDLVHQNEGAYVLGVAGKTLWKRMQEAEAPKPKKEGDTKSKAAKENTEAAPAHNERTLGHVRAVREAMPGLKQTDDEIAAVVWRVKATETAIAKAKEAFA